MEDPKQSKADLIPADDYGGFEEFDSIEDEHPPEDAKKKVAPPPKKDLILAMKEDIGQKKEEAQALPTPAVKKAKSIKKLKEELGPLTEDVKDDMVEALNELKAIVRIKRRLIYDMLLLKNKEELREINERINANRIYIDGDPDAATGEENVMRRMPSLEGRFLVTFRGFVDVMSSFQLSAQEKVLKLVLDKLGLYNWRIDTVDYPNFFAQLLRFKGEFNSLLMKFNPHRPLKLSDNKSEMAALIQKRVREVLKKIRANPDLKKESKGRERNKEIDLNVYTPKLIIERLQEECLQSNVNPKKQLEKYTLQNKDVDSVTYDKLKDFIFNDLKFVGLSTVFVDQLFRMLDWKATERVSLNDVVSLIYGENKEHLLTIPRSPEELLVVVSDAARFHYDLGSRFMKFCKHADPANIKLPEFVTFVTSFTRLKEEHCKILFQHLEQGGKGVIFESNILNIYEYTLKKDKADPRKKEGKKEPTLKELKSHDNSELDERFKSFNNMDLSGIGGMGGFGGDGPQVGWGGTSGGIRHGTMENLEDQGDEAVQEFSVAANNQVRLLKDEIEEQVMRISVMTLEMIKYHGKNIKDLFQMFADKLTRMMNFDEFYEAVKFITKDEEAEEAVLKNLYFLFSHPMSKKLSFSKFLALIEMGKKMNSIYVKLKKRFGEGFMDYRALFLEELQRMNIKKADGYVPFIDVRSKLR